MLKKEEGKLKLDKTDEGLMVCEREPLHARTHARTHACTRGRHALTDTNVLDVQDDILNELEHL